MVVQFFKGGRTYKGAKSAVDYLLNNERVSNGTAKVFKGNSDLTLKIISNNNRVWKFTSGVISFEENYEQVKDKLDDIIKEFEKTFFPGLTKEQYNTFYVLHTDKGRAELHFIIPRTELTTGKDLSIYTHTKDLPKKDIFQQYINNKFELTNPLDKGKKRTLEMVTKWSNEAKELKKEIHSYVEKSFEKGLINSRDEIIDLLKQVGFDVKVSKKYISVKTDDMKRGIRLKGVYYEESYTSNAELAGKFTGTGKSDTEDTQTALRELKRRLEERIYKDTEANRKKYSANKQQDLARDKQQTEEFTGQERDKEPNLGNSNRDSNNNTINQTALHDNTSEHGQRDNSYSLDKKIGGNEDDRIRDKINEFNRAREKRKQTRKRREQERIRRIEEINNATKQVNNAITATATKTNKLIIGGRVKRDFTKHTVNTTTKQPEVPKENNIINIWNTIKTKTSNVHDYWNVGKEGINILLNNNKSVKFSDDYYYFYLYNKKGICGIYKTNEKEQNLIQGNKGLFIDGGGENVKDIYIFESPIDMVAYRLLKGQQSNPDRKIFYVATMGALENTTKETLEYIFNHYPSATVWICANNKQEGHKIKDKLLEMTEDRRIRINMPPYAGQDWYKTFILNQKQKNNKIKKDKGYKDIGF
jgi:hypothetical protein